MGKIAQFFAPFRQRGKVTLIHDRGSGTEQQEEIEREAEAEVAWVEEDDKYFGADSPADQDELLWSLDQRGDELAGHSADARDLVVAQRLAETAVRAQGDQAGRVGPHLVVVAVGREAERGRRGRRDAADPRRAAQAVEKRVDEAGGVAGGLPGVGLQAGHDRRRAAGPVTPAPAGPSSVSYCVQVGTGSGSPARALPGAASAPEAGQAAAPPRPASSAAAARHARPSPVVRGAVLHVLLIRLPSSEAPPSL